MIRQPNVFRSGLLAIGVMVLGHSIGTTAQAGPVYDAVNDFSLASNPNGPWSYGSLSGLSGGTFTAFTNPVSNGDFSGEQFWYNGQSQPNAAVVSKNASGSTQSFETIVQPTNVLRLDGQDLIADVRWTAPTAGVYSLSGFFERLDTGNQSVTVSVLVNGVTLFSASNFSTFDSVQNFSDSTLTLAAGAVIDFAESAPQFNNDSTGLSATITNLSTSVPEPSSIALVLCGLAGLMAPGIRNRLRKSSREPSPLL